MKRLKSIGKIGWALCAAVLHWNSGAFSGVASDLPPNIVFILVDDQGYYDLGCYGASEIQTPRIDEMAESGTRLTDYYAAAPICSPSRAGLLTGCYPRRVGNEIWVHRADSQSGIHPDELTLPELLKANGYATACIGKWHLGFQEPFLPHNQGFDHYFGLLHNLDPVEVVYFDDKGGVPLLRNGDVVKRPADPAELTKLYTDEAIEFIKKNKDGPFFVYLPHTMLHNPLGVSEEFQGSSDWGQYGDAIQELDHNVGRIFDSLKELRIDDNTIVIYASDNGRGPGRTPQQKIRGHKLSTYEGGIRVPAIAWGPGLGLQSGVDSSAIVRAMDWYPTLATFAGIKIPEGRIIDGRDISPLLKGETKIVPPPGMNQSLNALVPLRRRWNPPGEWAPLIRRNEYNDAFFYHGSQGALAAVRWKNWKLFLNPSLELYDLAKDPGESELVRNGEITRKLRGMAILFQEEMRLDARRAGEVSSPPRADGRTREISAMEDRGQIWRQFLGGSQQERPETYRLASPLHHLDNEDPPCWFITGETDDPSTHADEFRSPVKEVGFPSGLTVIHDAPHPFLGKQIWFDEMIEVADEFFSKHLRKQKSAHSAENP